MPNSGMILEVEILVDKGLGTYLRKYSFKPLAHNFFFFFFFNSIRNGKMDDVIMGYDKLEGKCL